MTLEERAKQLQEKAGQIPQIFSDIAKNATVRAVEAAAEQTPPMAGSLKGTHTRTGELKQHWSTDSVMQPKISGGNYDTELANNMQYASYVNDGHRMDRHFVPGLYINEESGMLEYDPGNRNVGITVGTKTKYVKGLHMTDAGIKAYEKTVESESAKLEELLK